MSFLNNIKKDREAKLIMAATGAVMILGAVFAAAFDKIYNKAKDNACKDAAIKCKETEREDE